ncbi:MAG: hypothetical protein LC749_17750, partial [Actinobacteria bacterium]|nr:hypothetical protein [Actinomycetota bacterium]
SYTVIYQQTNFDRPDLTVQLWLHPTPPVFIDTEPVAPAPAAPVVPVVPGPTNGDPLTGGTAA